MNSSIADYVNRHKHQPGWADAMILYYTSPMPVLVKKWSIEVNEKYYRITHISGFVEIVRRDSKFTSGYMSPDQVARINEIESTGEFESSGETRTRLNDYTKRVLSYIRGTQQ
jgi:hypothetical protein